MCNMPDVSQCYVFIKYTHAKLNGSKDTVASKIMRHMIMHAHRHPMNTATLCKIYEDPVRVSSGRCLGPVKPVCKTKIDLSSTCLHDVSEYGRCKGPTPMPVLPGWAWPWALRKGAARGHAGRQKPFIQYEKAGHIHSFHGPPDSCEAPETSLSRVRN